MSPNDDDLPPGMRSKRSASQPPRPAAKPVAKSAAAKSPAKEVLPVAEPADPEDHRLAWGHVGSLTRPGRLSDGTSRPGVIRVVEANIQYYPPPLDPYVWVQASMNYVGQYEMFWTEGDPIKVASLADLAAEFHRDVPSPPRLRLLDNVADSLLGEVQKLHARDGRVGLLHLGNVLIVPNSDGRRVVLPDLGFVWRGSHGTFPWRDSPGRPRWLEEDPRLNQNAKLWDEEPAAKQFISVTAADGEHDLVPIQSDLRNLARVFSAVLTGRIERDLPHLSHAAPTWGVLRAVMKGDITSAAEFRSRLAEHPLSEHWTAPKAPPPPPKSKAPAFLLMGCFSLLVLTTLGSLAGLYFAGVFDSPPPLTGNDIAKIPSTSKSSLTPTSRSRPPEKKSTMIEDMARVGTSAASAAMAASPPLSKRPITKVEIDWKTKPGTTPPEIADILKLLENAKDPAQVRDLLLRLYGFYETADEATRSRIRQWVEYWRALYLDGWESRYRKADEAVIKNPGLRFDVGKQIHELHQELKALRQRFEPISPSLNERENQCLFISELRARELGSPP